MRRVRLALALIVAGVFLPLIALLFVDNYWSKQSLMENLQEMSVPITSDRTHPDFQIVSAFAGHPTTTLPNGDPVEYSPIHEETIKGEIARAQGLGDFEVAAGKKWRFCGWRIVQAGFRIRYRIFLILGSCSLAAALLLLISAIGRRVSLPAASMN